MAKITSMRVLRDKMLQVFDDLEDGKIDINQAMAFSKLNDSIINGLKSEIQYAIVTNQVPSIPFYGEGSGKVLDKKELKKLL